jgi:peptidoglycan/LPS O-acetylase OafA/YrhL
MHLIQLENGSVRDSILQFQVRIGLQGVAAFLLLLPLVLGTRASRFHSMISSRRLAWVGVVSYGVYLWHQAIIRETIKHTNFSSDLFGYMQLMAIVLPVSILIGWISFRFLERPMLSLARRSRKADQ